MARFIIAVRSAICMLLICVCLTPMVGCIGLAVNLLNVMGAGLVPAAYPGLKEKKVAVVCISNSSFGPTSTAEHLGQRINQLLATNVKEIQIVPQQEIDDWTDRNEWDNLDFIKLGRGVEADIVVAIDINRFGLRDGSNMYKGRANISMVVYDVLAEQEVFSKEPPEIVFPINAGIFVQEMSERDFKRQFLNQLADRIARHFYPYDMNEDVAGDAGFVSSI